MHILYRKHSKFYILLKLENTSWPFITIHVHTLTIRNFFNKQHFLFFTTTPDLTISLHFSTEFIHSCLTLHSWCSRQWARTQCLQSSSYHDRPIRNCHVIEDKPKLFRHQKYSENDSVDPSQTRFLKQNKGTQSPQSTKTLRRWAETHT